MEALSVLLSSKENIIIIIFVIIIFILLVKVIQKYRKEKITEGFESERGAVNESRQEFVKLLGQLLDDVKFANQIIIDHNVFSFEELIRQNRAKVKLRVKPIIEGNDLKRVQRFLDLRDIYFTLRKKKDYQQIIELALSDKVINPEEIYKDKQLENKQLNNFRSRYYLKKHLYQEKTLFTNMIDFFIETYGLKLVPLSYTNFQEFWEKNYYQGEQARNKIQIINTPRQLILFNSRDNLFYWKNKNNQWFSFQLSGDFHTNLIKREIVELKQHINFFKELNSLGNNNTTNILENVEKLDSPPQPDNYLWIYNRSDISRGRLILKMQELIREGYFNLSQNLIEQFGFNRNDKGRNKELNWTNKINQFLTKMKITAELELNLLESIIIYLNQRVVNIFDDFLCYMIFYQYQDIRDLYLDKHFEKSRFLASNWRMSKFEDILKETTKTGQCVLPASFKVQKVQQYPPLYKFYFNSNLYHTFFEPIRVYVSSLENHLSIFLKNPKVEQLLPIARFCVYNNNSFRKYIEKYIACDQQSCPDVSSLDEPTRCSEIKLKFQELTTLKNRIKCLYNPTEESDKEKVEQEVNQRFGFTNSLLLDIVDYALKVHLCQSDEVEVKNCQDLIAEVDLSDQKDDVDLRQVIDDSKSDLYNYYDQQLKKYQDIIHKQETKDLSKLNNVANLAEEVKRLQKQESDLSLKKNASTVYDMIQDFQKMIRESNGENKDPEKFENLLLENLDLNDLTKDNYLEKIREIKDQYLSSKSKIQEGGGIESTKKTIKEVFNILTKDGRMMTTGGVIVFLSLCLYFIDITS